MSYYGDDNFLGMGVSFCCHFPGLLWALGLSEPSVVGNTIQFNAESIRNLAHDMPSHLNFYLEGLKEKKKLPDHK